MKHRIEAQGGNQAHLTLPAGMPELDDTVGLIPKHGDGDLRQPAPYHPDHLACPLGDGLVSQPQALTDLWRWRRHAQDGQGPATAIPGWRDDQGQHDPAKATGADGALAAGSQRVAVMTALADTSAPASLQRFVNDEREAAASGIEGLHRQGQQTATAFESGPASTIEHLMVETERRGIALPRVSQGGRDGASSVGQQGSDEQALDFAPSGCAKETLKGRQGGC